ncbi:hypothetical protein Misp03_67110 [Microbispora sp. NBRC 16548]|nr:hypothetical protein Misp03_67110 [Microbispora sp. NBRC 16548]
MDGAALQHSERVLHRQALVEAVGAQGDLDVVLPMDIAHAQHRVDDDDVADHHVAGLADRRGRQMRAVARPP